MSSSTEEHQGNYKDTEPKPHLHDFDVEFMDLHNQCLEAEASNQPPETITKIKQEAKHLKERFLLDITNLCHQNGTAWPNFTHPAFQAEDLNKASIILSQLREHDRQADPNLPAALRKANAERTGVPGCEKTNMFVTTDGSGEHQFTEYGNNWYVLQCGPLRCGELATDGSNRCSHGLKAISGNAPPGWIDRVGWKDGKNVFQLENQGLWDNPRYVWQNGVRTGPRYYGPHWDFCFL
ncbi:hypothetical protein N0V83_010209 [Neocucurbitaria cava]|uniref:Uncharacterized protein n=1 Tax=Neocucurbitaria cava TaxID=798079 RepID=A0A9W8XYF2_9PLEO|nr:hypothetical protein N0V83_010209 [Neocucurbitaria cava]